MPNLRKYSPYPTGRVSKAAILAVFIVILIAVFSLLTVQVFAQASLGLEAAGGTGLGTRDLKDLIMSIVQILLGFLGIVAVIIVLYGGFLYMTSEGEADKVDKAKKVLINAAIGLLIILSAFAIVTYVINRMEEITQGGGGSSGPGPTINGGALGGGVLEAVYPEPGAFNVPRNTLIMTMFNEEMNSETIINQTNPAGCLNVPPNVTCGIIAGDNDDPNIKIINQTAGGEFLDADQVIAMTSDNKNYIFDPVEYLGNATTTIDYTVNLSDAIERLNGNAAFMAGGYSWSFQVSTVLDLEPPHVTQVIPLLNQSVYMNAVVQMNFNEAVNIVGATLPGNIAVYYGDGNTATVSGTILVSNLFKTIEFISNQQCLVNGQPAINSCGETPYCLPANSLITPLVKAAIVNPSSPLSGVTDAAGNSLDGGIGNVNTSQCEVNENCSFNGQADGRPTDGQNQFDVTVANDNYWWNFSTTGEMDLDPPEIIEVILPPDNQESLNPDDEDLLVPRNQYVKAFFSEYMRSSSLSANNIKIFNPVLCTAFYGDCNMENNEEWPLEIVSCDYNVGGTCLYPRGGFVIVSESYSNLATVNLTQPLDATKVSIHTYYPYLDPLTRYNPRITSAVQDMYQNCFYPSTGPASN